MEKALDLLEHLTRLGFQKAMDSGASMSPFIGESIEFPPEPSEETGAAWLAYSQEVAERIAARSDYDDPDMGPQLLSVKSGARGSLPQLLNLAGVRGAIRIDIDNTIGPVKHCFRQGLTPAEAFQSVIGAREGLASIAGSALSPLMSDLFDAYGVPRPAPSQAFTTLARAMRSANPGAVFARAAAIGEVDPLTDLDSRLFVGLGAARER